MKILQLSLRKIGPKEPVKDLVSVYIVRGCYLISHPYKFELSLTGMISHSYFIYTFFFLSHSSNTVKNGTKTAHLSWTSSKLKECEQKPEN